MSDRLTLHASCVLVAEVGILLRGASGSGKSSLALRLIEDARRDGRFGALVADDRVILTRINGRIIARPHPAVAGLVEVRGLGLARRRHEEAAVLGLVVDCDGPSERLPDTAALTTDLLGIVLPTIAVGSAGDPERIVRERIRANESALHDTLVTIS